MEKQQIIYLKNSILTTDPLSSNFKNLELSNNNLYLNLNNFFKNHGIITYIDKDIILSYTQDWSNIKGWADLLVIPKNVYECSIILRGCFKNNISITISSGRTNLTGSATPNGGVILSMSKLV